MQRSYIMVIDIMINIQNMRFFLRLLPCLKKTDSLLGPWDANSAKMLRFRYWTSVRKLHYFLRLQPYYLVNNCSS